MKDQETLEMGASGIIAYIFIGDRTRYLKVYTLPVPLSIQEELVFASKSAMRQI